MQGCDNTKIYYEGSSIPALWDSEWNYNLNKDKKYFLYYDGTWHYD